MHHREFISQLAEQRIVKAIGDVEKKTSGEIRVYVSHKERHDALAGVLPRAEAAYRELAGNENLAEAVANFLKRKA